MRLNLQLWFSRQKNCLTRYKNNWKTIEKLNDSFPRESPCGLIKSKKHRIGSYVVDKISLSCFDDKRYIHENGVTSFAYGHGWIFGGPVGKFDKTVFLNGGWEIWLGIFQLNLTKNLTEVLIIWIHQKFPKVCWNSQLSNYWLGFCDSFFFLFSFFRTRPEITSTS